MAIVAQKGWQKENFMYPMILLEKKERERLGLEVNRPCWVKNPVNGIKIMAVVQKQLKALVKKGATVNHLLAAVLHLALGQEVELEPVPHPAVEAAEDIVREDNGTPPGPTAPPAPGGTS